MPIARTQAKSATPSPSQALSLGDMEVVLALVRGRTLAEAAARLGADPSTVFRSLQRIEKALGQRLFERGRAGYLPSEPAAEVAKHAERIEAELEAARSALSGPADAVTGRVKLSTTDSVMRGLVLPLLPALAKAHPQLRVEVRTGNELVSLTRRDADLALRATRKPPEHVVGRHLGTMRFVVAASAKRATPSRARGGTAALAAQDWIAPDEALPDHPSVQWRRRHLPKLQPRLLVDGITGVADAIAAGVGIGIVPVFVAEADTRLKPISDPLEGCESELWILAHPESRHLRRIATVYQALVEGIAL
jgi:DNA-binding transcriptional LysR family regulator